MGDRGRTSSRSRECSRRWRLSSGLKRMWGRPRSRSCTRAAAAGSCSAARPRAGSGDPPSGLSRLGPGGRGGLRAGAGGAGRHSRRSGSEQFEDVISYPLSTRTSRWSSPRRRPAAAVREAVLEAAASCCARPRSSTSIAASSWARGGRASPSGSASERPTAPSPTRRWRRCGVDPRGARRDRGRSVNSRASTSMAPLSSRSIGIRRPGCWWPAPRATPAPWRRSCSGVTKSSSWFASPRGPMPGRR